MNKDTETFDYLEEHCKVRVVGEYKNARTPVDMECLLCGGVVSKQTSVCKSQHKRAGKVACTSCQQDITKRKKDEEYIKLLRVENRIECLELFKGANTKILMKCLECGHEAVQLPGPKRAIYKKTGSTGCSKCRDKLGRPSARDDGYVEFLKDKCNVEIVGNYNGSKQVHKIKCIGCGIKFKRTPVLIKQKFAKHKSLGCTSCNNKRVKKELLKKHGVDHYNRSDEYIKRVKKTNNKKYGKDYHMQVDGYADRLKEYNLEKFGVDSYSKTQECKDKMKATNLERYKVEHHSQKHLSKLTIARLNNFNYLHYVYTELKYPATHIADILKCDSTTVYNCLHHFGIPISYQYSRSYAEIEIEEFLLANDIEVECSNREILGGKEIDLYLPEFKIGIEYNGLYWHSVSPANPRMDKKYHARKTQECNELGVRLIQIFEDEWIYRKDQVKAKLLSLVGKDPRSVIYARKCKLIDVSTSNKKIFFDTTHIQGSGPGSINVGLEYEGELVACMSFIKQKEQHYLNRYATSCRIPGGFSKLLKYFKNNYEWELLISFADLRWSDGNLYEKTGWELDKIIAEDYAYVVGDERVHKFNYRRKFLPDKLETFDPSLSEVKNCANNGLYPIYDCGKMRFVQSNHSSTSSFK